MPLHEETDVLATMPSMTEQVFGLLVLALPVASIAWTVTHKELLREFREFCEGRSRLGGLATRKFFYVFTCEYCFSHYVALVVLAATGIGSSGPIGEVSWSRGPHSSGSRTCT